NENPTITAGADASANNDPGSCSASVAVPAATFGDNCTGSTLAWTLSGVTAGSGSGQVGTYLFNIGVTTINYTVTDASGNTAAATQKVTVTDNENPTITAGADASANNDPGSCSASVAVPAATFGDNCTGSTLAWTLSGVTAGSGSGQVGTYLFNIGVTTINYTVTDASGNSATATQKVTVTDSENPTITAGADASANNDPGSCSASVAVPAATFGDNCTGSTLAWTLSGVTAGSGSGQVGTYLFNIGVTTINYTVTDASGNSATATQKVTVTDSENPTITAGADASANNDPGSCSASVAVPAATFGDNCTGSTLAWTLSGVTAGSGSGQVGTYLFNIGVTTINYTVTDASGNTAAATQKVTVTDSENPTITAGADASANNDPGSCSASVAVPAATFGDNCTGSTLAWTLSGVTAGSGSGQVGTYLFNIGVTTINYTVTDASGNTAAATQKVTVTDNENPTITAGADASANNDPGSCSASVAVPAATFGDNCTGSTLAWTLSGVTAGSGSGQVGTYLFNIGVTTINYTVTDASGNTAAATQKVTVTDNENPTITAGADASANNDPGSCSASVAVPAATFGDNCTGSTLAWTLSGVTAGSGSGQVGTYLFNIGVTTINYTVTDASGNTAAATQKVTVTDNENPTITAGADASANNDPGSCSASVAVPAATFGDNCTGSTLAWTLSGVTAGSGSGQVGTYLFNIGVTTINYTVTDASGNTAAATQKVTVTDN